MPMLWAFSLSGSTCTRTAYFCEPCTCTCDTPLTIEMRGASTGSATSSSVAGARQAGVDLSRRELAGREIAHRQRAVRDDAEEGDGRHQQAGGDGTSDENLGDVHDGLTPTIVARGPVRGRCGRRPRLCLRRS